MNYNINVNQDINLGRIYQYTVEGSYRDKRVDADVDIKVSEIFVNDEDNNVKHMFGFLNSNITENLVIISYSGTKDNPAEKGTIESKGDFVVTDVDGYSNDNLESKIMKSLIKGNGYDELTVEKWKDSTMIVKDGNEEFEVTFKLD